MYFFYFYLFLFYFFFCKKGDTDQLRRCSFLLNNESFHSKFVFSRFHIFNRENTKVKNLIDGDSFSGFQSYYELGG